MKRLFLALIATSFLTAPMAMAQDMRHRKPVERHEMQNGKQHAEQQRHGNRWKRGERLSRAQRGPVVGERDYRRHNLQRPGRGQQWVRVGNDYLLISAATGLILGITAGR